MGRPSDFLPPLQLDKDEAVVIAFLQKIQIHAENCRKLAKKSTQRMLTVRWVRFLPK